MSRLSSIKIAVKVAAIAVSLAVICVAAGFALARATPPAPRIASHPAKRTRVREAPAVKVAFPARGAVYASESWRAGCSPRRGGLCGTVLAPSGVKSVLVWVRRNATNRSWNGHAFKARHAVWVRASLSPRPHSRGRLRRADWFYRLSLPKPDGRYTVLVRATDRIGNITRLRRQRRVGFTIDRDALPPPQLTRSPANPTTEIDTIFAFSDPRSDVGYHCSLDSRPWTACGSPAHYAGLSAGTHHFKVRAVAPSGKVSTATAYTWVIAPVTGLPFTIGGYTYDALYPGAPASEIPLALTNPNSSAIVVTSVTTTLARSSLPGGCSSGGYVITQADIPSAGVKVPAHGSVTLPARGATTASIQMIDTNTDQDPCRGAHLKLNYTGRAHS